MLESLAHTNFLSPRPHPIDPAVFYDVVKIRRAVDEATNLAVRAATGIASAALANTLQPGNGPAPGGHGGGAAGASKLSKERKHRMRELATQKLAHAYYLDEIAASVATMQSASTLEDVAQLVLQRSPTDTDAKYVHFFHEKIPSRMMAQSTPLAVLDDMIAERPSHGSPWRTRALTRLFKHDYLNAARDLTEGLAVARHSAPQHGSGKDRLLLVQAPQEQLGRDWRSEIKVPEEDQPTSIEMQLLFHRAGVYFALACQHVHASLDGLDDVAAEKDGEEDASPAAAEARVRRLEARKQVKTNAKRAVRDYIAFLSHFDYTPGLDRNIAEDIARKIGTSSNPDQKPDVRLLEHSARLPPLDTLVPRRSQPDKSCWPKTRLPQAFQVSELFAAVPPASLPPYPQPVDPSADIYAKAAAAFTDSHEAVTYHPLLTDALHSLLLCHTLIQTPSKELLRHALNAARLVHVCDGYPLFLASRSPARADWIEVLRRTKNWIDLPQSWESLCRPAALLDQTSPQSFRTAHCPPGRQPQIETDAQRRERQKHEAVLEALVDERVVDEETFQRSVAARQRRILEDEAEEQQDEGKLPSPSLRTAPSNVPGTASSAAGPPKRWAQDEDGEYSISTERADAIVRWVLEAPTTIEAAGGTRRKPRKGKKAAAEKADGNGSLETNGTVGVEDSVAKLSVEDATDAVD